MFFFYYWTVLFFITILFSVSMRNIFFNWFQKSCRNLFWNLYRKPFVNQLGNLSKICQEILSEIRSEIPQQIKTFRKYYPSSNYDPSQMFSLELTPSNFDSPKFLLRCKFNSHKSFTPKTFTTNSLCANILDPIFFWPPQNVVPLKFWPPKFDIPKKLH